jgi:hypothetical protein
MLRFGGRACGGALRREFSATTIRLHGEQPGPLAVPLAAALERSVTLDAAESLRRDGYAVIDGVFGAPLAAALREEVLALRKGGHMARNATHLVSPAAAAPGGRPATLLLEKRGIHEAEAHALSGAAAQAAPRLVALSKDRTLLTLLTVYLSASRAEALHSQVLKAQFNDGGAACFPLHFDTDAALDARKVTALFYLNPQWQPAHGGELVLYPLPRGRVVIEPRHDRLVLFAADSMLHRVLPSAAERVCFTLWLFARDAGSAAARSAAAVGPPREEAPPKGAPASPQLLLHPALAKFSAKAALSDEWRRSMMEAHPESAARDAALATFAAEVAQIEQLLESRHPGAKAVLQAMRAEHALPR